MTQLLGFQIFRTVSIPVNGSQYTIRFASSRDNQEHFMLASNDETGNQVRVSFDTDTADGYKATNDEELTTLVLKIIGEEIRAGRV